MLWLELLETRSVETHTSSEKPVTNLSIASMPGCFNDVPASFFFASNRVNELPNCLLQK